MLGEQTAELSANHFSSQYCDFSSPLAPSSPCGVAAYRTVTWPPPLSLAGYYTDLHSFTSWSWAALSAAIPVGPSRRYGHGFSSAGGRLFVQGGWDTENSECAVRVQRTALV